MLRKPREKNIKTCPVAFELKQVSPLAEGCHVSPGVFAQRMACVHRTVVHMEVWPV